MKIDVTRRDLFKFAGGAAAGVLLTPVPWKAIDDLAIWTQNWHWIPVPPKGPVTTRPTVCSLCPAGCPVEARCIGGLPVSLRRLGGDGSAALCTLGLTGHHLPYHPARLPGPSRVLHADEGTRRFPVPLDAVVSVTSRAIAAAGAGRRVAVLDMRPGRSVSWAWRRLLASLPGGVVIPSPAREGSSLAALGEMTGSRAFGVDPGAVRTILSFGAPLAEGWGAPEWTARLLNDPELRLIQVEPLLSPTAQAAERWLAARPGTETILALGIGHVLLSEHLVSEVRARDLDAYAALVARFTPEVVAERTGVPAEAVVRTARELVESGPSLVIAGDDAGTGRLGRAAETAILGLNLLLGSSRQVTREKAREGALSNLAPSSARGTLMERSELPAPFDAERLAPEVELDRVEDHSIGVLLIDAAEGDLPMPWSVMKRKLAPRALVVAISPYFAGTAARADYIIPAPTYLESIHELPTPFDSPVASLRLSAPLLAPRVAAIDPVHFIRAIAASAKVALPESGATSEALMRARVARIHAEGKGSVTSPTEESIRTVAELASADELWDALLAGACWRSDAASGPAPEFALLGGIAESRWMAATAIPNDRLSLVFHGPRDVTASSVVSPVLTKLYQESGLRRPAGGALVNPATLRALALKAGSRARLETAAGAIHVTVTADDAVMPGVVEVSIGPASTALERRRADRFFDVLAAGEDGAWRSMSASLREA
ncbi:MAG: molybdopterin dinucleotide binding domain-containing protein [Thermoanaerobaculia bacterium]